MRFGLFLLSFALCGSAFAGTEGMPNMPKILEKKTFSVATAEAGEELREQRGFGDKEPEVSMMNLMMVGGSGYEGMEMGAGMAAHHGAHEGHAGHGGMAASDSQPVENLSNRNDSSLKFEISTPSDDSKVGMNTLEFSVQEKGKPLKGLKITAKVSMQSMDMGTTQPLVKEVSPGVYRVKVAFSMRGPWAVRLATKGVEKEFQFSVGVSP
jgi:hypothetical protein